MVSSAVIIYCWVDRLAKCGLIRLQPRTQSPQKAQNQPEESRNSVEDVDGRFDNAPNNSTSAPDALTLTVISPFGVSAIDVAPGSLSIGDNIDNMDEGSVLVTTRGSHRHRPSLQPASPMSLNATGVLKLIESKLLDIIQDEIDRKVPTNLFLAQPVDFETEESILSLIKTIDSASDMLVCMDFIDCIERFSVFQYPVGDLGQQASQQHHHVYSSQQASLNPVLKSFCCKLELLRQQFVSKAANIGKGNSGESSMVMPYDTVSLSSSPAPDSMLSMSSYSKPGTGPSNATSQPSSRRIVSLIEFSINFHQVAANKMLSFGEPTYKLAMKRLSLLDCYEVLRQQCISPTMLPQQSFVGIDPGSLSRSDSDFMDNIHLECRKNTIKAEALCWALRVRRQAHQQHTAASPDTTITSPDTMRSAQSVQSNASGSSILSSVVGAMATKKVHKPMVTQISPHQATSRNSVALNSGLSPMSAPSVATTRKSMSTLSEMSGGSSSSSSSLAPSVGYDLWDTAPEDLPLSFGVFFAFVGMCSCLLMTSLLLINSICRFQLISEISIVAVLAGCR
jgi:hypothetical protein